MRLPTGAEYQDAVQTPRLCFEEPELRAGRPEVDAHGLPVVASGNFASVYKIVGGSKPWAVKCFTRYTPDLERRYGAISQHLKATNPRFHVPFEYLPRGIRVESEWYPTVKMQWVEGLALNDYVSQRLRQGNIWILPHLAERWYELASALRGAGVAHCDLTTRKYSLSSGANKSSRKKRSNCSTSLANLTPKIDGILSCTSCRISRSSPIVPLMCSNNLSADRM